ncbi:MAG TPA: PHP domain-containing protein [Bacillus sp. (in: firmicutes)]|nr:PHP domain-containing protein [Bacillus sp. (in: firmicutes)]
MDIRQVVKDGAYDLHMHTTASDGALSPKEVVCKMKQLGKRTIAITDHDTMDGIEEAIAEGERIGVHVIPGIELTTYYQGQRVDILGYGLTETPHLQNILQQIRNHREHRASIIVQKFQQLGMNITMEDVHKFSKGGTVGRPHIAKAVVAKGYAKDLKTVFDLYLGDGKPCSVEKMALTPKEGIELIQGSGGVAVLAHPAVISNQDMIEELLEMGFDGIEVYHPLHTIDHERRYMKWALHYNLFYSGGSDFHG